MDVQKSNTLIQTIHFTKEFLAENINNPEQMGYEMESIGPKTIVNDTQKIVSYFKKLLNIDEIWHV